MTKKAALEQSADTKMERLKRRKEQNRISNLNRRKHRHL
jgi:hypothetical protein